MILLSFIKRGHFHRSFSLAFIYITLPIDDDDDDDDDELYSCVDVFS